MSVAQGGRNGYRLLINDDVIGLRVREALLRSIGYEVLTASSGHDGIVLAHALRPDVVVLDYFLPDMNGSNVLREAHPGLPVIVLSGMLELPKSVEESAAAVIVKGDGAGPLLKTLSYNSLRRLSMHVPRAIEYPDVCQISRSDNVQLC